MIKSKNKKEITVSLDAMGGDNAPEIVIEGASMFLKKNKNIKYVIYGDENKVKPLIEKYSNLKNKVELIHTDKFISPDEKPA
ncbi:MAG: phosphate acyltransferase, partial [Alphaproteobacteria bacterium]